MYTYLHRVNYYETDKMGITHHSNYIRWMEEARTDFFRKIGFTLREIEESGLHCAVVSLEADYKQMTCFDDEIAVDIWIEDYNGVRLVFNYRMRNHKTGHIVMTASSTQCFLNSYRKPIVLGKHMPELDTVLKRVLDEQE